MQKRRFLIIMALLLTVVVFFWGVDQSCAQTNAKSKGVLQTQSRDFDAAQQRMKSRMELPKLRKDAAKRYKETRAASASKKAAQGESEGGTDK